MPTDFDETRDFWNRAAEDWRVQVGHTGDMNRVLNSDPVLWQFAGNVANLDVLDAGCGTGYLSKQLHDRGARVTGIDFSDRMIAIARAQYAAIDFRVDSCSTLATIGDAQFDLLVSNYVLMDLPDLQTAVDAFHRVLRPGGAAVLVFSHPCFPQGGATTHNESNNIIYRWKSSYFDPRKCVDPPWAHFTTDFIWFHRPLSDYWKAFKNAGFAVTDFEEPRIAPERYPLAPSPHKLKNSKTRPYSVAFQLQKP